MSSDSLTDILRALHNAVLETQHLTEQEHIRQLTRYTYGAEDDPGLEGTPRSFSIRVPDPASREPGATKKVDIPLLALMPPSSLRIRDLTVDFRAKLVGFVNRPGSVHGAQVLPTDPATHAGPVHAVLGAGEGDSAEFKVTFETNDPPEAFSRLIDRLTAAATS